MVPHSRVPVPPWPPTPAAAVLAAIAPGADTPARRPAFFMGDIYGSTLQGVPRRLETGKHQLRSIVAGKGSASFRCTINKAPKLAKASVKPLVKPDVVAGKIFGNLVSVALYAGPRCPPPPPPPPPHTHTSPATAHLPCADRRHP